MDPEIMDWLRSLRPDQMDRLEKATKDLLTGGSINVRSRGPQSSAGKVRQGSCRGLQTLAFGQSSGLSGDQILEFCTMVGSLRRFQMAKGVSDAVFVRRIPMLGCTKSWQRLAAWETGGMKLKKWYQQARVVCERMDKTLGAWRTLDGQMHPAEQFLDLLKQIKDYGQQEELTQRGLAKRAGIDERTWRRLQGPDAVFHFHLPTWLPRLRESVQRLGA